MWLFQSSVGRKFVMSITGIFLLLFLTFHSLMNVVVLFSPEGYNAVAAALGANWYALVGTAVLAIGSIVHMVYALWLTLQNRKARGDVRYDLTTRQDGVSWSSKNMLVLGFIILGFLVLHLYQFWAKMQLVEVMHGHDAVNLGYHDPTDGAYFIDQLFSQKLYSVLYIVWLVALWFHLTHGIWSALHTLGLNNKNWMPRVKAFSNVYATIVILIFLSIPIAYLFGFRI